MDSQPLKITDVLSRDEIRELVTPTDYEGWLALLTSWSIIAGSFALVAWQPHWVTILVALVLLGGRQLALAILMHEATHYSLFKSRWLNDTLGKWLIAEPVWQHLDQYRIHHMQHHKYTGTEKDNDLVLSKPFPVSKKSLARKFARDLLGISGFKRVIGLMMMDLGYIEYTASVSAGKIDQEGRPFSDVIKTGWRRLGPVFITNVLMFTVLALLGHGWLYLLWIAAYMTTFSLFVRIRSIAEHAGTDHGDNPWRNTRTTYANWLERLTIAPHRVNYHLEHHLLMTVPHYRLKRMHKLLKDKHVLDESPVFSGYWQVLSAVVR